MLKDVKMQTLPHIMLWTIWISKQKNVESKNKYHLTRQKHYLKGRLCLYETDIGKTLKQEWIVITENRTGVSTSKFHIHISNCSERNKEQLDEPFFHIHVMLSL